jgi:Ca2+-binding EF-hand superfamily protein
MLESAMRNLCVLPLMLFAGAALAQAPAPAPAQPAVSKADAGTHAASPEQLFSQWDSDKNRLLSLDEFRAGWDAAREANLIGRLQLQFRGADTNRSGALEVAEYAALPVVKRSGASAPPFSTFDTDKNQRLDFKEFLGLVQAFVKRASGGK